jgi:hypothetical protein
MNPLLSPLSGGHKKPPCEDKPGLASRPGHPSDVSEPTASGGCTQVRPAVLVLLVHLVVILIFFSLFLQFVLLQRIVDIYICIWSLPFDQAQGLRLH